MDAPALPVVLRIARPAGGAVAHRVSLQRPRERVEIVELAVDGSPGRLRAATALRSPARRRAVVSLSARSILAILLAVLWLVRALTVLAALRLIRALTVLTILRLVRAAALPILRLVRA